MTFHLASAAFAEGKPIPRRHTCDGEDLSPPLSWTGAPAGTRALALIVDDPDAPARVWVHWVIFDIPADTTELPEGISQGAPLPAHAREGVNDSKDVGYSGPCPPPGTPHRYRFTLYALDTELGLDGEPSKSDVLDATKGHVLGETRLIGTYHRADDAGARTGVMDHAR
ncbi:MAG: YbhB/YbcL family Raf kinase inhibitor-like protein [Gemmatimonadaceae bacterium]